MGKPSNADLITERRAITAILDGISPETEGKPNTERIAAAFAQFAKAVENARIEHAVPPPFVRPSVIIEPGEIIPADEVNLSRYPMDTANYGPPPVPSILPGGEPAMSPMLGDLTPGYPTWNMRTHGLDAVRAKYADRMILTDELKTLR